MIESTEEFILKNMVEILELPDSAYEKAKKRYEDIGDWFNRNESVVSSNSPHIFPQGSFRLGTAIRPLNETEEYDLDLACKLKEGINKDSHSQEYLKSLIGTELESYRIARGIKNPLEEKHRCWRLEYQDDLSFHMDIVPCVPATESRRKLIFDTVRKGGMEEYLAGSTSSTTVAITDNRNEGYRKISDDWNISNPEGYAQWFESLMFPQKLSTENFSARAEVDKLPLYKRKTPLQRVIQILKRHRDQMFKDNPDCKPISIIITTLATRAYNGESNLAEALKNIISTMENYINPTSPRVPNPVDPEEDFADRWGMEKYRNLDLEQNFKLWLRQVNTDAVNILSSTDAGFIHDMIDDKFAMNVDQDGIINRIRHEGKNVKIVTPKQHRIERAEAPKPWCNI